MTAPVRRIRIAADLERLAEVRQLVREAAEAAGATTDAVDDLVQAVDEAATNIVVHGYAGRPGWVEVEVAVAGPELVKTMMTTATGPP